ncbi:MAG: Dna2/Cas4 domain-containing protein [Bacteroidota bacterium]
MHSIFSAIDTADYVDSAVRNLVYKGIITDSDSRYYVSAVSEAIANPLVAEWYSGQYKTLNEQTIISKTDDNRPTASRPDRVMIDGRRAIVVDYKFGQPQAAHRRQIVHYMSLLEKMGYSVEGYLWYVKANNIERVLL